MNNHVIPSFGTKKLGDVRRRDVQRLVDELSPELSGSRVRSVVNAIHSLYRWAQAREIVYHDPASLVQLPAMESQPRDRVASPRRDGEAAGRARAERRAALRAGRVRDRERELRSATPA